jgi:hypothetical protein
MPDLPQAVIAHVTDGRIRLKVPARKHDAEFFSRLEAFLGGVPGIDRVEVNPLTGSVLVIHTLKLTSREDLDLLASSSQLSEMFTLASCDSSPVTPHRASLAQAMATSLAAMNSQIKGLTGGVVDVPTLAIVGLLAIGIRQLRAGVVYIPAVTALWYASSLLKDQLPEHRGPESP